MRSFLPVIALLFFTCSFLGQQRWSAEFRPALSIPFEKLGENDIKTGYGFEAKIGYKLMPHVRAYGGWTWNEFRSGSGSEPPNVKIDETGYTFGLELTLPITRPPLTYYLFAGGVYNKIDIEDITNNVNSKSDHGLGWQMGGGLDYEFATHWSVRPEVKYHSLKGDVEFLGATESVSLNYIGFSVGLLRSF